MATFSLGKHPHVELCDLLKLEGWSESGAQAKIAIAEGQVKVDGAVETRKRCKIVALLFCTLLHLMHPAYIFCTIRL
ncbi:ribosome-associated protein YbcJ [Shigella flexneri]|uniref:ribosome-associated protein YbcJ n=1 Tax=Shigella flexneri TaxID=623 RepID=UPI000A572B46|nr:ribosome-associated protein YbcJ [Shigella flexneri]